MSESTWDDPRITSYVLGEMPGPERKAFEIEINNNPELAAAVEEASSLTRQLSSLFGSESVAGLDENRRAAIAGLTASVQETSVSPPAVMTKAPTSEVMSWRPLGIILAIAAAFVLMIGIAPWLRQRQQLKDMSLAMESERLGEAVGELDTLSTTAESLDAYSVADAPFAFEKGQQISSIETRNLSPQNSPAAILARGVTPADPAVVSRGETTEAQGSLQFGAAVDALASEPASRELKEELESAELSKRRLSMAASSPGSSVDEYALAPSAASAAANSPDRYMMRGSEVAGTTPLSDSMPMSGGIVPADGLQDLPALGMATEALGESTPEKQAESRDASFFREQDVAELELLQQRGAVALGISIEGVENLSRRKRLSSLDAASVTESKADLEEGEADYVSGFDAGRGPDASGDKFEPITDNAFLRVNEQPLSTFSVDVDTASYSKVRDFLLRANQLPRPDAVRIEELVNYFSYAYEPPADSAEHPFAARVDVTSCPWNEQHRLARVALKGKMMETEDRPKCNLVFLIDTSGSMNEPNKLPLVIDGLKMLLTQLKADDKVAIAVYAGSAGLVLDSTPVEQQDQILKALSELAAGGSTNGGAGIALAYQTARDHFISEGVNRVILCTDGDFNVGVTGTDELVRTVEQEAKGGVFLSVLGFGMGNHNDAMLEQVSGRGNGNYAFIDTPSEAHKVFVEQTNGTLVTIAKDVKLQIEFNPKNVYAYRLIGYENRVLAKEDFKDDTKDAGEIGAGHSVTALYEIVPAGVEVETIAPQVDDLRYQKAAGLTEAADTSELLALKLRYKEPDGDTSKEVVVPIAEQESSFADADDDFRFAAAVASFGMQLRRSPHAGNWTMSDAMNAANRSKGDDRFGLRSEFITLVQKASELMGEE